MDPDFRSQDIQAEDIQDLIEGRLAPERVDAVRARLASDAELRAAVQEMAAQRRALQRAGAAEQKAAESNPALVRVLVRSAMARASAASTPSPAPAERSAPAALHMAGSRGAEPGSGRARRPRAAPLVALMAAFFAVGLGSMWMLDVLQRGASRTPHQSRPPEALTVRTPTPSGGTKEERTPGAEVSAMAVAPGPALPDWLKIDAGRNDSGQIGAWADELSRSLENSPTTSGLGTLELLASPGHGDPVGEPAQGDELTLQDAAKLALQGRLRFFITMQPARAPDAGAPTGGPGPDLRASSKDGPLPRSGAAGGPRRGGSAGASLNGPVRVEVRLDPDLALLQDRLSQLVTQAERAGQRVRLEVLDPASAERSSTLPGTDVNDVLWWNQPTSDWSPSASLLIPLRRE